MAKYQGSPLNRHREKRVFSNQFQALTVASINKKVERIVEDLIDGVGKDENVLKGLKIVPQQVPTAH